MRTRCKFRVVGVEDVEHSIFKKMYEDEEGYSTTEGHEYSENGKKYKSVSTGKFAQNVRLAASYDTKNPEDVSFAEATPSGELKIYVSNPVVVGSFRPGKNYYLDLIPCE